MSTDHTSELRDPTFQAFALLRTVFTVAPILFGLDKFFDILTDWNQYLAPWINDIVPGSATTAMEIVGVIEVAAGILRSEEHTSELQSHVNLVCRLLLEKKKKKKTRTYSPV